MLYTALLSVSSSNPLEGLLQGGMQGPLAGFGGQAGWPPPKPAFASFVLGLYSSLFHSLFIEYNDKCWDGNFEWRTGTRLKTGGHASLYGRPVSRTVPYWNRTVFPV
jgi:hypothetical protein